MFDAAAKMPRVSVLMYHQVGHFPKPESHRAVYCDVSRFKAQMACLEWGGYNVIPLTDACNGIFNGAFLPPKPVVLTFDDGYQNFADEAWPLLRKHGYPATVFIVTRLIGKPAKWLDDGKQARLMDASTIRSLAREGVNFGSHTLTHCRLSQLDRKEQRAEIMGSKSELEDILGKGVADFCYPYGDYTPGVRDMAAEGGYRSALTCIRGAANFASNPFEIPRKAISYGDSLFGFFWKLEMKHARKDSSSHNPAHVIQGCSFNGKKEH